MAQYPLQIVSNSPIAIDDAGARAITQDDVEDDQLGISALPNGGFAIHWLADIDDDQANDTLAVRRYLADGSADGGIVTLALSQQLTANGEQIVDYELTALENGGYALSYEMGLPDFGKIVQTTSTAPNLTLVGRPTDITILNAPVGTTYAISGVDNDGFSLSVPVVPVAGVIHINEALLDQFGNDNRLTLMVTTPNPGETITAAVNVREDVIYDPASGLQADAAITALTIGSSTGVFYTLEGRIEAFHVSDVTFDNDPNTNNLYILMINPSMDASFIDLTGTGATLQPNGTIQLLIFDTGLTDIVVPQSILDQIGEHDASMSLVALGIDTSQPFAATGDVRSNEARPEGLYFETFNAAGVMQAASTDFSADGKSDVLFRGVAGNLATWELDGTSVVGGGGTAPPRPAIHGIPCLG